MAAFLIYVGTRQLPTYIEKKTKNHHVGKKVAKVGFVWHPDTLFKHNGISVGTSLLCKKYLSKFISKTGNNALYLSFLNYLTFFFFGNLISLDTIFVERYLFLLIKIYG